MDRISAAKVLIVEDDRDKAHELLLALGRRGIGAAWVTGDSDGTGLPEEPLSGVRILFLDINLEGIPNETDYAARALVDRLTGCLQDDAHPLAIVVWSTRGDAQEVARMLGELWTTKFTRIAPKVVMLDKDQLDSEELLKRIPKALDELGAINLLFFWEQLVADAAADTTTAINEVLDADESDQLLDLLHLLHKAAAPPEARDSSDALAAVAEALNVVLEDRVLRRTAEAASNPEAVSDSTLQIAAQLLEQAPQSNAKRQARLNRFLLVAPVHDAWEPRPGNIYLPEAPERNALFPVSDEPGAAIRCDDLLRHSFNLPDPGKNKDIFDNVVRDSVPILLELTPECDHAQQRMARPRLLAGVMTTAKHGKRAKDLGHVYASKLVHLEHDRLSGAGSGVVLLFNALMWFALPLDEVALMRESFRLRKQLLNDVQAWFGYHANRPGVLQIDR